MIARRLALCFYAVAFGCAVSQDRGSATSAPEDRMRVAVTVEEGPDGLVASADLDYGASLEALAPPSVVVDRFYRVWRNDLAVAEPRSLSDERGAIPVGPGDELELIVRVRTSPSVAACAHAYVPVDGPQRSLHDFNPPRLIRCIDHLALESDGEVVHRVSFGVGAGAQFDSGELTFYREGVLLGETALAPTGELRDPIPVPQASFEAVLALRDERGRTWLAGVAYADVADAASSRNSYLLAVQPKVGGMTGDSAPKIGFEDPHPPTLVVDHGDHEDYSLHPAIDGDRVAVGRIWIWRSESGQVLDCAEIADAYLLERIDRLLPTEVPENIDASKATVETDEVWFKAVIEELCIGPPLYWTCRSEKALPVDRTNLEPQYHDMELDWRPSLYPPE